MAIVGSHRPSARCIRGPESAGQSGDARFVGIRAPFCAAQPLPEAGAIVVGSDRQPRLAADDCWRTAQAPSKVA